MTARFLKVVGVSLLAIATGNAQSHSSASADHIDAKLQRTLEKMAGTHHGKVALVAMNLDTGTRVAIHPDEPVPTASTIKLAVFIEAFQQIKEGKKSIADRVTLQKADQVEGSGVLQLLQTPLALTLEDVITLMMAASDNTATNLVIDQLGLANINARLAALGLKQTVLYKKVFRKPDGPMPPEQPKFGLGKTTAREMAVLMAGIARCELADANLCKRMIEIMKSQQYRNMIPHYIESGVDSSEQPTQIADKVGQLDESRSDVAIVYTRRGPIVISAYTWANQDQRWTAENEGELLIARMAKAIADAWGK